MWGIDRSGAVGHAEVGKDALIGAAEGGSWDDSAAAVPVSSKDPSWGSRSAPATIVVYSDFECPYCSKVVATLDGLKEKYGPDKLRIVWKHHPLPFHKNATPAHIASQIVFELGGSEAFWKFHDLAFQNRTSLNAESFAAWAVQAGVDKAKFDEAFKAQRGKDKVDADVAGASKVGVRGTPAFLINGKFLSGARPQENFEQEINAQLEAAKKLAAAGTPADQVYVKLTNDNFSNKPADAPGEKEEAGEDDKTVWKVAVPKNRPYKGNPEALVTIVEFSEFQCPFCSRVLPTVKQILDTYGDKVRVVFMDNPLPFHKRALPASMLAHEAMAQKGQKGFWAAHDLLFENQKALEDDNLWSYAQKLGLDVEKAKVAVLGNAHKAKIADNQDLASELNASGTPHFFINGRRLVGAQPFEKFKTIIDEEIGKSQALLAKGIAPAALYGEIIKNGKEPPPPEMKEIAAAPDNAPSKGAKAPKVTMHEFSDFQCPFCARVTGTVDELLEAYPTTLRVVWRHKPLPFHKDAPLASEAAQEAFAQKGNSAFWAFHDKLFAGQKEPGLGRPQLESYAEQVGLDLTRLRAALDGHTHKAFVDAENEASNKVGVRGTPGFVIVPKGSSKGYFISGAQPTAKFRKLVDRALKEAK